MENEDVIRREMEETRSSLTEKVETLEQKLVNTVQETKEAVTETVTSVKETMHESVATVKNMFDIEAQVQERPWTMLGGAVAAGFFLGSLLSEKAEPAQTPPMSGGKKHHQNGGTVRRPPQEASAPSWLSHFEPELARLKSLALGAALGTVREMISGGVPAEMGRRVRDIIDDVTKKVGGAPIPSSDWADSPLTQGDATTRQEQGDESTRSAALQEPAAQVPRHGQRFSMQ